MIEQLNEDIEEDDEYKRMAAPIISHYIKNTDSQWEVDYEEEYMRGGKMETPKGVPHMPYLKNAADQWEEEQIEGGM